MTDPMAKYLLPQQEDEDPMAKYLKPLSPTKPQDGIFGDVRTVQNVLSGGLDALGGVLNTAGSAATGINKMLNPKYDGTSFLTNFGNKLKSWSQGVAPETPADGTLQKIGDIAGRFAGAAIATAPIGGASAKIASKALSIVPTTLTTRALQATAAITDGIANPTARGFIGGALRALPSEALGGTIAQAAIDPESLTTAGGVAQAAGFTLLGAGARGFMSRHNATEMDPLIKRGRDYIKESTRINFPTHAPDPLESSIRRRQFGGDASIANKPQQGPYPVQEPIYGPFPLGANPDPVAVLAYASPNDVRLAHGTAPNIRRKEPYKKAEGPSSNIPKGRPLTPDDALGLIEGLMEPPRKPQNVVGTLIGSLDDIGAKIERKYFNAKSAFRAIDKSAGIREEHGLEATANLLSGNSSRVHGILHDRPMLPISSNPNDSYVDAGLESLKDVLTGLPENEIMSFGSYMHARHRLDPGVIDNVSKGGKHPIAEDIARLAVQDAPEHWVEAAKKMDALNKFNLDYLHRSEVLSNSAYDWMVQNYPSFVSLSRGLSEKSFSVPTLRRGAGSEVGKLRSPFQTYIENTIATVNIAENNRFKKQLYQAAVDYPEQLQNLVKVRAIDNSDIIDETMKHIQKAFNDNSVSAPQAVLKELAIALAPVERLGFGASKTHAFVDGIKREMIVNDDLAEALASMSFRKPDPYIAAIAKAEKIPRTLTSIFLDLTMRGPAKDWLETYVNSASVPQINGKSALGYLPVNPFKGLAEIRASRNSPKINPNPTALHERPLPGQYFQELQANGGVVGNRFIGLGAAEMDNNFKAIKLMGENKGLKFALKHPIQALEGLAADLSQANRVAAFMRMRDNGMTARQSAIEARRIIPDPMQAGAAMRGFSQATSFGNTGLQAIKNYQRVFSSAKDQKQLPEFMIKGMIAHVIPAMTFWAIAKANNDTDLDEIRRAPGGDKFMYLRNPVDPETIITIPKGWGWGQVFGTGTEAALDKMFNDDPKAGADFVKGVLNEVGINVIPLSVQAGVEAFTGKRIQPSGMFTDSPASTGMDSRGVDGYQTAQNTTALSQYLGEKAGISPVAMDQGIKALVTSEGFKWVNTLSSVAFGETGMNRLQDAPEIGGWIRRENQSTNTRSNSEFYKEVTEARNLAVTLSKLEKAGDVSRWGDLLNKNPELYAKIPVYGAFATQMGEFKQLIEMTKAMPNDALSPAQKRRQIDGIIEQMNDYTHIIMKSLKQ